MSGFPLNVNRKRLVDCAMGRIPADLVIKNGKWVCVQTGEIINQIDIAIIDQRIAYVGSDASPMISESTRVIDAAGRFMLPGLLDAHMHVESGMLTVTEFVRAIIPHGTTGIFIDPHEIANVFGLKGIKLMVDEAAHQPIHVWVQVPSCVPSAPGMETGGISLSLEDVQEALAWDGVIGLGEMMNYPGVAAADPKMLGEIESAHLAGKVVGGHYASPNLDAPFHGYVAGGAEDDHEGVHMEDAVARARQGMKVMMRYGSAWQDVASLVRAVLELGLDSRNFLLCTDDSHSHTLFNEGHMDRVIRHAIAQGLPPMQAIQMSTMNTANHFGVSKDFGMIAPGRYADICLVSDLYEFNVELVIAKGVIISQVGHILVDLPEYKFPDWAIHSVNLSKTFTADDFSIHTDKTGSVDVHVIGVVENQAPTNHLIFPMEALDGQIRADVDRDLVKVALIERHHGSGRVQFGFVNGFGFDTACAFATTVSHDSHQLIVLGTDDNCMAKAVNALVACNGGQVVVINNEVKGIVELPIGGLMSNETGQTVARKAANVLSGLQECGCKLNNPNMQMSLLGLVVIPELRISDLGLVDVLAMKFINLVE